MITKWLAKFEHDFPELAKIQGEEKSKTIVLTKVDRVMGWVSDRVIKKADSHLYDTPEEAIEYLKQKVNSAIEKKQGEIAKMESHIKKMEELEETIAKMRRNKLEERTQ